MRTLGAPKRPALSLIRAVLALACIALLLVGAFGIASAETVRISPIYRVNGKSLVGGPFTLTNHRGERVTDKDFHGKLMIAYFGYTYCPDICPRELQVITAALERLGDRAAEVQPVFITIDPERDTVEHLAQYVGHFSPNLIGLTGTAEQILEAAKAYRVLFQKVEDPESSDYLMNHSTTTFLMDRKGEYAAHFVLGTTVEEMVEGITNELEK